MKFQIKESVCKKKNNAYTKYISNQYLIQTLVIGSILTLLDMNLGLPPRYVLAIGLVLAHEIYQYYIDSSNICRNWSSSYQN